MAPRKKTQKIPYPIPKGLLFTCQVLNKDVTAPFESWNVSCADNACDICGSHGHVTVTLKCECGKEHNIELRSW